MPAPTDLGDMRHSLAESGIVDAVTLAVAAPTAPHDEQVAAFDRGITLAGDDAFLVVWSESGRSSAIEERLPALAARGGCTLVVAPLDGTAVAPKATGSPYLASITFDLERAKRHRWPAISAESWSKVADEEGAELAARARAALSDELDAYLAQSFFIAEHATAQPGESVTVAELRTAVERLVVAGAVGVHE